MINELNKLDENKEFNKKLKEINFDNLAFDYCENIDYNKRLHFKSGKWYNSNNEEIYIFNLDDLCCKFQSRLNKCKKFFEDNNINKSNYEKLLGSNKYLYDNYINYERYFTTDKTRLKLFEKIRNYDSNLHWNDNWNYNELVIKAVELENNNQPLQDLSVLGLEIPKELLVAMYIKLFKPNSERQLLIISGSGGTGKSTILNLLKQIYNNKDIAYVSPDKLEDDFRLGELVGKRLCCCSDIPSLNLNKLGILKAITSKEPISVNNKNEKPFSCRLQSTFIFCTNNEVRFDIEDNSITRRLIIFPMNKIIDKSTYIEDLNKKIYTDDEIITLIRHIYRLKNELNALKSDEWFDKYFKEKQDNYIIERHRITDFINKFYNFIDNFKTIESINRSFEVNAGETFRTEIYNLYVEKYCKPNGYKQYGFDNFTIWYKNIISSNYFKNNIAKD